MRAIRASPRSARRASPSLFHAFAYANEIWKHDPFDVGSIHPTPARRSSGSWAGCSRPSGLPTGRILLLLGESGCGKTHLMRAFRNQVHCPGLGILRLPADDRVHRPVRPICAQQPDRLARQAVRRVPVRDHGADAALERPGRVVARRAARLAGPAPRGGPGPAEPRPAGRRAWPTGSSSTTGSARSTSIWCRPCSTSSATTRGSRPACSSTSVARTSPTTTAGCWAGSSRAPTRTRRNRIIERLGQLMWAVERVPLILCVDQLEDIFDLDEAAVKFRRAHGHALRHRQPAPVGDRGHRLPRGLLRRAQEAPDPADQGPGRERPSAGRPEDPLRPRPGRAADRPAAEVPLRVDAASPSSPISRRIPLPDALVRKLVGLRARDVLGEVQIYRERCIAKGKMADVPF